MGTASSKASISVDQNLSDQEPAAFCAADRMQDILDIEDRPSLAAAGFYEAWGIMEDDPRVAILDTLNISLSVHLEPKTRGGVPPYRRLAAFWFCLGRGFSPDTREFTRFEPSGRRSSRTKQSTIWHLLLWHSVISTTMDLHPEPLYALFLVYGANPYFYLSFDPSHGIPEFETYL
jgi:hypothetical protein